jgi:CheY-like chemotaxis protein
MKHKKILIVDDDSVSLKMLKKVFNGSEFHILLASGGPEAVNIAKNDHPDLIILDILMPDMEGSEVARILKSDPLTQNIPIIFLSSLIKKEEEKSNSIRGGIFMMAKPFNRNVLLNKARELI